VVFARLAAADGVDAVLDVLRGIEGPFAFVYYDAAAGRVFFGRDRLGRRSLLMSPTGQGELALCSVPGDAREGWREVEADGIYVVAVGEGTSPERYDWVVGEDAADFVSTLAWSAAGYAFDRGRPSRQTYFTLSRFPALASSTGHCPLPVVS
jgi:asparagine synthetase B (glutamine-hydrolysing)